MTLTPRQLSTSTPAARASTLLTPVERDADTVSIRSDQDSDSDDDQLLLRARNSRELRAHDRLVFLEEDETDRLVTDARRQEPDPRGRRGSGLVAAVRLLGQAASRSRSPGGRQRPPAPAATSVASTAVGSTDSLLADQHTSSRAARRQRRRSKKARLLAQAGHGEDGALLYELEEGGLRSGSATGDSLDSGASGASGSSSRGSSSDVDGDDQRQQLLGALRGNAPPSAPSTTHRMRRQRARRHRRCGGCCGGCRCRGCDCCGHCGRLGLWLLLALLAVVAAALLALGGWKLARDRRRPSMAVPPSRLVSNGTMLFAPTTLLISLDGFRADFLQRGLTPRLNAFVREGVSPPYMRPSFPSVTFPNHHTLATGLYPESHGVVGNTFWDPALQAEFYYTDPARSLDPKWWGGEPFWVTAERAGVTTAVHMWPGSEAHILGVEPSIVDPFDGTEPLANKVRRVLGFLDLPAARRPQLIAAYVPNVDADGHRYGPNSTEIRGTIAAVDGMLDDLFRGLEQRNLTDIVNVVVVSDHGMATTDVGRLMQLEDLLGTAASADGAVGLDRLQHVDGWPLVGLRPARDDDLRPLHADLLAATRDNPNVEVYLRDVDMPARYHFAHNARIAPLWLVPKTGWNIVSRAEFDIAEALANGLVYHPRGLHGYDHEHPLMRAIFVARGPAFPHAPNSRLEVFQNIEVYNMVCDSLGLTPHPNNGTLRLPLSPVGFHTPADLPEAPADPVPAYTLTPSAAAAAPTASSTVASTATATETAGSATASSSDAPSSASNDTSAHSDTTDKATSAAADLWHWFTDKLDTAWAKLTGSQSD